MSRKKDIYTPSLQTIAKKKRGVYQLRDLVSRAKCYVQLCLVLTKTNQLYGKIYELIREV